jgi:hypothetical protein
VIAPPLTIRRAAVIDASGQYRYVLYRWWCDDSLARQWRTVTPSLLVPSIPFVLWVMLNPSTADAEIDDPTIRRCFGFTTQWGYEMLAVVNLFARRCTDPKQLRGGFPVGPLNDVWIAQEASHATRIIAAWGASKFVTQRDQSVKLVLLHEAKCDRVEDLARTKSGHPRHPLYVHGEQRPELHFLTKRRP